MLPKEGTQGDGSLVFPVFNAFHGEYMTNYGWAGLTAGALGRKMETG